MKIYLYLYDYELTFTGVWNCLFFPNVGDRLYIFPYLTEEDKADIKDLTYGDVASDIVLSPLQDRDKDVYLLRIIENIPCIIEKRTWNYIDNEWICNLTIKV